jgi:hypothetical protein
LNAVDAATKASSKPLPAPTGITHANIIWLYLRFIHAHADLVNQRLCAANTGHFEKRTQHHGRTQPVREMLRTMQQSKMMAIE